MVARRKCRVSSSSSSHPSRGKSSKFSHANMPGSKDREGKAGQTKRSVLEYPRVMEAFHRPPAQQDQPPHIQQDLPHLQQPPNSPEERWYDPDEFLASSDLYLAQVPSSAQKHKASSSDSPITSRPTEPQQASNEPEDKEDIQDFLGLLDRSTGRPPALNSKPRPSLQPPTPREASQANIIARSGSEDDSSSQQKSYTVRIPPPRRIPKEKDPRDLDFREDHFG